MTMLLRGLQNTAERLDMARARIAAAGDVVTMAVPRIAGTESRIAGSGVNCRHWTPDSIEAYNGDGS